MILGKAFSRLKRRLGVSGSIHVRIRRHEGGEKVKLPRKLGMLTALGTAGYKINRKAWKREAKKYEEHD